MRARRPRIAVQPMNSINLTPLLDICFNLLLAFMIVAPTFKSGLPIDLPKVDDSVQLPERKSYTISIQKPPEAGMSTRVYLQTEAGTPTLMDDVEQLRRELDGLYGRHGSNLDIVIEPDRDVTVEPFLKVLGVTNALGIKSVGVLTEPEGKAKQP